MSRDARFDYASSTSDSDRGWDFREIDTRPLPIAKIIMAVAVVGLVFATILVGALIQ